MIKEIKRSILKNNDIRRRRYWRRKIIVCLVILLILFVGFVYKMNSSNYNTYKIVSSIPNKGNASGCISYRNGVIKYSKDGASYNKDGKVIWNFSYEMNDPIADVSGNYAVISDRGGKLLYIFNEIKCVGRVTTLYDIVKVAIASQGVVAAQMSDDDNNYVQFYYENGSIVLDSNQKNMLVDIKKNIKDFGYLMDIDISKDGKKLVLDFFLLTTGKLLSNLGFYNYGEVGQNKVDRFVGGYPYEDIVIPRIVFLRNDVVCAFKDNGFMIYSMPEEPELIYEKTFERKIQSIIYSEKYVGVVLTEENSTPKQILLYDLKGSKILDQNLDFEYSKILLSGDEIIMYNNTTCFIIKSNGVEKFKQTFDTDIRAFLPSNHNNKYILVNDSKILEIVLSE